MRKILKAIIASNFKRLNSPLKISYAVTYRCNLKCRMCHVWAKDHHENELSVNDVEFFFRKPHHLYWLGITGGEPFLRDDLGEVVDAVLKNSNGLTALHFATNGTFPDRIVHLADNVRANNEKIKIVFTISIDGPPDLHNKIRGQQGVWENALKSFELLKKIKNVKPQFGFTLAHDNIDKFEETFTAIKDVYPELRFDDITVNVFQRSTFYYGNAGILELDPVQLTREIKKILKMDRDSLSLNNFLRRSYLTFYLKYLRTKKSPVKCQSFASTCFLDPYGNLFPCLVYNRKALNIKERDLSLEDIWKLKETKKIHNECAHNRCPTCWSPCDAYSAIGGSLLQTILRK